MRQVRQQVQHFRLHIHRHHFSPRAHTSGETSRDVTAPGADVGDNLSGLQLKLLHQPLGGFLVFAFRPLEPIRRGVAHDLGDFAAHVELADPVRMSAAILVTRQLGR